MSLADLLTLPYSYLGMRDRDDVQRTIEALQSECEKSRLKVSELHLQITSFEQQIAECTFLSRRTVLM